jgi:transposase-like protein
MEERKDSTTKVQRSFSLEFKRQVVEELLGGENRPTQLCRRHNISPSILYYWKKQYSQGKSNNEPTKELLLNQQNKVPPHQNLLTLSIQSQGCSSASWLFSTFIFGVACFRGFKVYLSGKICQSLGFKKG